MVFRNSIVSRRRRGLLAATAWFLAAYYLLAAGRAFIPGLCATQAALVKDAPAATLCCAPREANSLDHAAPALRDAVVNNPLCAFCTLVTTPAQAPSAAPGLVPIQVPLERNISSDTMLPAPRTWTPQAPRAPPHPFSLPI